MAKTIAQFMLALANDPAALVFHFEKDWRATVTASQDLDDEQKRVLLSGDLNLIRETMQAEYANPGTGWLPFVMNNFLSNYQ